MIEYEKKLNEFHRKYYQEKISDYYHEGYKIWHLTITWNDSDKRKISPKILKERINHWWLKNLIPHIYQTRKFTTKSRLEQPYCIAFLECGKETSIEEVKKLYDPVTNEYRPSTLYKNPHHHVVIATTGKATSRFIELIGVNTLKHTLLNDNKYSNRKYRPQDNMTRFIKETCLIPVNDFYQIKYTSKDLWLWGMSSVYEFEPTPKPTKRLLQIRLNDGTITTATHKQYVSYQEKSKDTNCINTLYKPHLIGNLSGTMSG